MVEIAMHKRTYGGRGRAGASPAEPEVCRLSGSGVRSFDIQFGYDDEVQYHSEWTAQHHEHPAEEGKMGFCERAEIGWENGEEDSILGNWVQSRESAKRSDHPIGR